MVKASREFSKNPDTYWTNHLCNTDSIARYYSLGEEIMYQTNGEVDAFVHCAATMASLRGVAQVLEKKNPDIKTVAVEPGESPVLSGRLPGPHKIGGIGIGYIPPLWDAGDVDEIIPVNTADAKTMTRIWRGTYHGNFSIPAGVITKLKA